MLHTVNFPVWVSGHIFGLTGLNRDTFRNVRCMMKTLCSLVLHLQQHREHGDGDKAREEGQKQGECRDLRVLCSFSDDLQGNELPDFTHQKRDASHCLDWAVSALYRWDEAIISFHPLHTRFSGSLCWLKACIAFVSLMVEFVRSLNVYFCRRCRWAVSGKEVRFSAQWEKVIAWNSNIQWAKMVQYL